MKKQLLTLAVFLTITTAYGQRNGVYRPLLTKVEVQGLTTADSTTIKIDSTANPINPKYSYVDSTLEITWDRSVSQFNFELKNKRNETIKLIWDDASYIDTDGSAKKVFHAGVKYIERNNSQPATTIIKGSKLSDLVAPTENVYYSSGTYGGWRHSPLFTTSRKIDTPILHGKDVRILLPISYGGASKEYVFTFTVKWVEDTPKKKKK